MVFSFLCDEMEKEHVMLSFQIISSSNPSPLFTFCPHPKHKKGENKTKRKREKKGGKEAFYAVTNGWMMGEMMGGKGRSQANTEDGHSLTNKRARKTNIR